MSGPSVGPNAVSFLPETQCCELLGQQASQEVIEALSKGIDSTNTWGGVLPRPDLDEIVFTLRRPTKYNGFAKTRLCVSAGDTSLLREARCKCPCQKPFPMYLDALHREHRSLPLSRSNVDTRIASTYRHRSGPHDPATHVEPKNGLPMGTCKQSRREFDQYMAIHIAPIKLTWHRRSDWEPNATPSFPIAFGGTSQTFACMSRCVP